MLDAGGDLPEHSSQFQDSAWFEQGCHLHNKQGISISENVVSGAIISKSVTPHANTLSLNIWSRVSRRSAGGIGLSVRVYICGTYDLQCTCVSNKAGTLTIPYIF